jgi:hypothetical protein
MPIALVPTEFIDNLLLVGKPTRVMFGENIHTIGDDIEYASAAFDQLGVYARRDFESVCQTGSS